MIGGSRSAGRGGLFRLRKWYCDFLTPAGDYCFVYYAEVALRGRVFRICTLHRARDGEETPATCAIPVDDAASPPGEGAECDLRFRGGRLVISDGESALDAAAGGSLIHLTFTPVVADRVSPVEIRTRGEKKIRWRPLHLRSAVTGLVAIDGIVTEAERCDGYIDFVESTILPPFVPIRTLRWGRLHAPGLALTFMSGGNSDGGKRWSRLMMKIGERMHEVDGIMAHPAGDGEYTLTGAAGSLRVQMHVRHRSAVQQGSFVDHREMPSSLVRSIVRRLTRDPRSTKWLSTADLRVEEGRRVTEFRDLQFIDECAYL